MTGTTTAGKELSSPGKDVSTEVDRSETECGNIPTNGSATNGIEAAVASIVTVACSARGIIGVGDRVATLAAAVSVTVTEGKTAR